MRVLLTGAGGYLGGHVLARLRERGCEIVVMGRSHPDGARDLPWLKADLLDTRDLAPVLGEARATHLLHLAWYTEHGKYWESPLNLRWVDASLRLLQAFTEHGGRHVAMAGTCAEYEWSGTAPFREDATPLEPASLYGAAKDATRRLAQAWCRGRGVSFAWGHVFFPFGPGEARQRMLPSLVEVFRGRAEPFGINAGAWRGMLPVRDAAEALVHLLFQHHDGRYNICSGHPVLMADAVRMLAHLCAADPAPVLALATSRPGDPQVLVGDNARLLATGWHPAQTWEQGLYELVQSAEKGIV